MKNKVLLALAIFGAALFFTACEEEENNKINDPYQRIEGKWNMDQFSMRGDPMPVEGSYWEFMYTDSENPPYQGIDSLSLYESAGTFEYEFSEGEDTLFVTDTLQYGGYFDGKWVIQNFEESSLEMVREYDDEWADTLKFSRQ
ncbi:MAG: hypothetical protein KGY60_09125 [Bacteroidales bacterium]|nr:hypothetical protein [Bacteroidales bacterium]